MNRCGKITCLLASLVLAGAAFGQEDDAAPVKERASTITKVNGFRLREPVPPPVIEVPPPTIVVKLTGITTILKTKRALLQITEQGKPPENKILREGDREGAVEIVAINEVDGTVKIINTGKEQMLSFEKDGVKPPTAPVAPPSAVPGQPGVQPMPGLPGIPHTTPGTVMAPSQPGGAPPTPPVISRPIRTTTLEEAAAQQERLKTLRELRGAR